MFEPKQADVEDLPRWSDSSSFLFDNNGFGTWDTTPWSDVNHLDYFGTDIPMAEDESTRKHPRKSNSVSNHTLLGTPGSLNSFKPLGLPAKFSDSPLTNSSNSFEQPDAISNSKRARANSNSTPNLCESVNCQGTCSGSSTIPAISSNPPRPSNCPIGFQPNIEECPKLLRNVREMKALPARRSAAKEKPASRHPEKSATRHPQKRASLASTDSDEPVKQDLSNSEDVIKDVPKDVPKPARAPKNSHCVIERRYRENLNDKFANLRHRLPNMHPQREEGEAGGDDREDSGSPPSPASKVTKADILTHAIDYVRQSEKQIRSMQEEILFMRERVAALEKLVTCEDCWLLNEVGKMRVSPSTVPLDATQYQGLEWC